MSSKVTWLVHRLSDAGHATPILAATLGAFDLSGPDVPFIYPSALGPPPFSERVDFAEVEIHPL
jgi:hypothetical protein